MTSRDRFRAIVERELDIVETLPKGAPIGVPYFRMVLRKLRKELSAILDENYKSEDVFIEEH